MIDKNSKWKCYYEFVKFYIAMSYFLICVEEIDLYFKSIADLELKQKLEILSESGIVTWRWTFNLQKYSMQKFAKFCCQVLAEKSLCSLCCKK